MINVKQKTKLAEVFKKNLVILAYLFGSAARGRIGPLSDIDIAVLFSEKVKKENYFDRRLKLASEIDKALKLYKTEVACLNEASPLLKHQAVFYGAPIFISDLELKRNFELRVLQEYEDTKYLMDVMFKSMEKRIKRWTFGKSFFPPKKEEVFSKII